MKNDIFENPLQKMESQFPTAMWRWNSSLPAAILTSNDAKSLGDLRDRLSVIHGNGYQFAGFMGFNTKDRISSVFDDNLLFLESIPFSNGKAGGNNALDFMTAHTSFFPVFIEKKKCVLNLFGSSEAMFNKNYSKYKSKILDVAFNPADPNLSCEAFSANTYEGFVEQFKKCTKYETAFVNVFAHGDRSADGEGTAIKKDDGWVVFKSDKMVKTLNGISKNVVYRTMCCFGAGTLMSPLAKHVWPDQFLPGMTERIKSKDGKSVMYIVNDVSTSPAYTDKNNCMMFSDAVMAQYVGKDITYGQFVDKFNSLVKRCKQSVFKNLRELFLKIHDQNCLFAALPDGTEITNKNWREAAAAQIGEIWEDLQTFGTKHPLNCFAGQHGKETYVSDTVFWKLYNRIANPPDGMCCFINILTDAFNTLEDAGIDPDEVSVDAYTGLKARHDQFGDLLFSIGLNLGAKALTRQSAKELMLYYRFLKSHPLERHEINEDEKNYPFRNKEAILGKIAYDSYSALDLFDVMAMSRIGEALDAYN